MEDVRVTKVEVEDECDPKTKRNRRWALLAIPATIGGLVLFLGGNSLPPVQPAPQSILKSKVPPNEIVYQVCEGSELREHLAPHMIGVTHELSANSQFCLGYEPAVNNAPSDS